MLREPATRISAPLMFAGTLALYLLTMSALYAVMHVDDLAREIETTDKKDEPQIPVSLATGTKTAA
jgi:hypothetical protein